MNSIDSLKAIGIDSLPELEQLGLGKYAERSGKIGHLAQTLAMLDMANAQKGVAAVRKAQDDAAVRTLGGSPQAAGEEMQQIVFGDLNQHLPSPQKPQGLSTLAKLGIAAALVASGLGAGAAIPLAISALSKDAPVVAPLLPTNTDTLTERDYSIGEITIESGAGE